MTDNRERRHEIQSETGIEQQSKESVQIAVNGTLMRGLELEPNLINLEATFVREDYTARSYRLFSIDDVHPGMIRIPASNAEKINLVSVAIEIWSIPTNRLVTLLEKEPSGLSIGKIKLKDGKTETFGVLAESALIYGKKDISEYPGNGTANFRDYIVKEGMRIIDDVLRKKPVMNHDRVIALSKVRHAAGLRYREGALRQAIDLLNDGIKTFGLQSRLFQNIHLRPNTSSHPGIVDTV